MHALVLSAAGINLQTLVAVARDLGVEDAWVLTNNAGDSVVREPSADVVIAILDPRALDRSIIPNSPGPGASAFGNLDVAIRAGRSVGQGYPVLLIAPPPLPRPADLMGMVVAQCPLDDYDVLRLHVWAFISTLPGRAHLETSAPVSRPAAFDATAVLDQLYKIAGNDPAASLQVERLIASLLSQVGAELVENPDRNQSNNRVDLAVLPSRESADILLVEVKVGRLTEQSLAAAEAQLQESVLARHASLGLVLYHDFEGKHLPSRQTIPLVIRMSVRELIAGLGTNTFPQLISVVVSAAIRRM